MSDMDMDRGKPMDNEDLLTADDVAELWKIPASEVREFADSGALGSVRRGDAVMFRPTDLQAFLDANSHPKG